MFVNLLFFSSYCFSSAPSLSTELGRIVHSPPQFLCVTLPLKRSAAMSLMGLGQDIEVPGSRNCEDDEEEEDYDVGPSHDRLGVHPETLVRFSVSEEFGPHSANPFDPAAVVDALVVGTYGAGASFLAAHFVNGVVESENPPVVGTLQVEFLGSGAKPRVVCEFRKIVSTPDTGRENVVLVGILTQSFASGPHSFDVAAAIGEGLPEVQRLLIVDSFASAQYRPAKGRAALNPPFIRCLRNTREKAVKGPLIGKKQYDAPNIIGGVGAHLLAQFEASDRAASWVGTAIGYEPHVSCLQPLRPGVMKWIHHVVPSFANLPRLINQSVAEHLDEQDEAALSHLYGNALRKHAAGQLRKSHMFL